MPAETPSRIVVCTAFTRPADTNAYASGDLVAQGTAGALNANQVVPVDLAWPGVSSQKTKYIITSVGLFKSGPSLTTPSFRVHFFAPTFTAAAVVTNADNGVFAPLPAAASDYFGAFDLTVDVLMKAGAMGWGIPKVGTDWEGVITTPTFDPTTSPTQFKLQALVEARSAYTPASAETFQIIAQGRMSD